MLKPETCRGCTLFDLGTSFSKPEGTGRNGVVIIGEALGHEEAIDGLPFRPKAQAGSKLQQCIELANSPDLPISREDFLFWNIVGCQPPSNKLTHQWYTPGAIAHCMANHFKRIVDDFNVSHITTRQGVTPIQKVILALGNTAFESTTGKTHSVLDVRGYLFNRHTSAGDTIVIPSLHPSYIKRGNAELTPLLVEDIKKAVRVARGEYVSEQEYRTKQNYRIVGIDEAMGFYYRLQESPRAILSYDIETPESGSVDESQRDDLESSEIIQIQFATDKWNAVIFPRFDGNYFNIAKQILELSNVKANHNTWNFDNPKLRAKGINIDETKCHDTQWMFKHWQPKLPRGLQAVASLAGFPFAWKHWYGVNTELYGGADVCSIQFILEWLPRLMKARGVWDGYIQYIYKLHPILNSASQAGIPVNDERRVELREKLIKIRKEKDDVVQKAIPDEIRNVQPRRKLKVRDTETGKEFDYIDYGYIKEPRAIIAQAREEYNRAINRVSKNVEGKPPSIVTFDKFLRRKYELVSRRFKTICKDTREEIEVERWCKIQEFKASKEQLSKYIIWKGQELAKSKDKEERRLAKFYKVPVDHEGKETTRKDEIQQLFDQTGDEVLELNLEIRSLSTNINNYIPNWKPSERDGHIHTIWGFSAASGQLDSRKPNVLNCSKHTDIGQMFRRIVEAPKGWSWVEFDKKSFHVATMGYAANDPNYIRFSQLDPHSIFTSYIMPKEWGKPIDLSMSDGEILERSAWIKKKCKTHTIDIRQKQAKPCILGNQLLLGPRKLYWQNRRGGGIPSEARARELQHLLRVELFPKVTQAQDDIIRKAAKLTYIMNEEFGFIFHCFDVLNYRWNKKAGGGLGKWEEYQGDEAREVVAFRVQGLAFGMIKDELFRILPRLNEGIGASSIGGSGRVYFPFRNSIHDSLVFLFRDEHLDTCIPICLEEMNKPSAKMVNEATGPEGLKVGVEYSVGRNWQNWHQHNDNCMGQECRLEENLEGMRERG